MPERVAFMKRRKTVLIVASVPAMTAMTATMKGTTRELRPREHDGADGSEAESKGL